jgi:tetratricopeptide (TPR) repeat protein
VAAGGLAALVAAILVYGPALNGPFVFDDQYLPFFSPHYAEQTLLQAIKGVRPLLYFTFWVNNRVAGTEPYTYHLLNVLLHFFNSLLVFVMVRKLLTWAGTQGGRREWLAAFAGAVFLLHPAQTEAVAYVASRSENLSALFFYAAFCVFLYRKSTAISWPAAAGVLVLYAAAVSTKEHTITLPALLLLTDYFWNPGFSLQGIRRNWRLYVPLAVTGAAGFVLVLRLVRGSTSAGFGVKGLPWYDYFYTQWRALWVYFRLFVAPVGQNADYNYPISRSVLDHGAIAGLAGLLLLVGCAVYFRKRFPLASYGYLAALILFAPTSSIVPIQDAVAERRLYLPMVALLLVVVEFLRRWKAARPVLAASTAVVLAGLGLASYQRNQVWGSDVALWEDTARKAPNNWRAHFQLGVAYYQQGRCESATFQFAAADRAGQPDERLLLDWALAEDCLNRPEAALEQLRRAVRVRPTAYGYSLMGMIYGKQQKYTEALSALRTALAINPREDMAYFYRGNVSAAMGDLGKAVEDFRRAVEINPDNELARRGLGRAEMRLRQR